MRPSAAAGPRAAAGPSSHLPCPGGVLCVHLAAPSIHVAVEVGGGRCSSRETNIYSQRTWTWTWSEAEAAITRMGLLHQWGPQEKKTEA